jgi:hypothetical protein
MGIYRLVQFVGIKTVVAISDIMATYLKDELLRIAPFDPQFAPIDGPSMWKEMREASDVEIKSYFKELFSKEDEYSDLARRFLLHSRLIAQNLVKSGVAKKGEDVDAILKMGFDHLYSPLSDVVEVYA